MHTTMGATMASTAKRMVPITARTYRARVSRSTSMPCFLLVRMVSVIGISS